MANEQAQATTTFKLMALHDTLVYDFDNKLVHLLILVCSFKWCVSVSPNHDNCTIVLQGVYCTCITTDLQD